ncbi:DUF6928 family protein [Actinomadura bangladeshensis]|uniref:Uncharacterized protein n=1 Tax=Actinomadura bangladeshensis TaxID=453573 RepID=A0A6L9QQD2_9ACTN|nr:hypothetical protein [Actinomadura bangladeshensis]NEA27645.1 hypothetical protein [Actinomadura bangladeshensis]
MGAKTALLAFAEGDIRPVLAGASRSDCAAAENLVRQVHPDYVVEAIADGTLGNTYPPDDVAYAAVLPGVALVVDRRLVHDYPSALPMHLFRLGEGRRIIMHGMHSVVDWLAFAIWENGNLVRSLSLSPDSGIMENIGEPLEFERPYWAGERAVELDPEWDEDPYPLPFHPLEMGEDALRALFGFVIEGYPEADDIIRHEIPMHGFRVTDPTGREQAEREAAYAEAVENMGPLRAFRVGPDGKLHEVSLEDL